MDGDRSKHENKPLALLNALIDMGLKLGAAAFLVVLAYIVYGFATDTGFIAMGGLPRADKLRLIGVVTTACGILWVSGAVFVVCVAARYYVEETLGYIISLLGVLLYLGTPYLFSMRFTPEQLSHNPAISLIVGSFRGLGLTMFVPGAVLIVCDIMFRVMRISARRKPRHSVSYVMGEKIETAIEECKPGPYAKCWQMPYCRKFVRITCMIYEAGTSCWKMKRGCLCDNEIMVKALRARGGDYADYQQELRRKSSDARPGRPLTARDRRILCRQCMIYEFHQQQKYKLISPLVFPVVIILMWFAYPKLSGLVSQIVEFTDRFMKHVSFMPAPSVGTQIGGVGASDMILFVFVVWLGIIIISYLLRLVEWCVFKLQI